MKEPNELTDRDIETLRKVESLLASPHSAPAEAEDVSVLLANTVPQADDAFRRQLDAQLMEKLERKQARASQQNGRAPSPTVEPPVVLTQPARVPGRLFNRVTGGLGSALVAATLVAALALATIFLWQSQRNMPPADNNGTPVSIRDPQSIENCGEGWTVNSPKPDMVPNSLSAVAVIATNDVWAVGGMDYTKELTMIAAHWDGAKWEVISIPEPGTLKAVAAVATDDVWAVGGSKALHWNGIRWDSVPIPAPEGSGAVNTINLTGVAAVSTNDVWAVGSYPINRREIDQHEDRKVILHWDGVEWSVVEAPNPSESGILSAVTALSADNVWAVGSTGISIPHISGSPLIIHWDGVKWSVVDNPSASSSGDLTAMTALSANDIWAVGTTRGTMDSFHSLSHLLILHWDGVKWSIVPNGQVSGTESSLLSIAAISASDVWAIGSASGTDSSGALIMRWNGTSWQEVPSPDLSQPDIIRGLRGVAASPSGDIWAVGGDFTPTGEAFPLVLRYGKLPCATGTPTPIATSTPSPSDVPSTNSPVATSIPSPSAPAPGPPGGTPGPRATAVLGSGCWGDWRVALGPETDLGHSPVVGVAAISANDAWAVASVGNEGDSAILHWDGTSWKVAHRPGKSPDGRFHTLRGIVAIAPDDVWVVGSYTAYQASFGTLTMHWDGKAWSVVPSPVEGAYNVVNAVAAISSNDVWAVGYTLDDHTEARALTMHWDGSKWSIVPTPKLEGLAMLQSVAGASASDVWAVGYNRDSALTLRWDGKEWRVVPTSNVGRAQLTGVSARASDDVWAVGHSFQVGPYGPDSYETVVMVLHWDGSRWSAMQVPRLLSYLHPYSVLAIAEDDAWIVGMQVLHWDGKNWKVVPLPQTVLPYGTQPGIALSGIASVSPTSLWAVGYYGWDPHRALIVQYTGSRCVTRTPAPTATNTQTPTVTPTPTVNCTPGWRVVDSPNPDAGDNTLTSVAAVSPNDIWAVSPKHAMHWDGTRWNAIPFPMGQQGKKISAASADDVWVSGLLNTIRWNGSEWAVVPVATPPNGSSIVLEDIEVIARDDVWLVGYYQAQDGEKFLGELTLIEHWDGKEWKVVPSPNIVPKVGSTRNWLTSISAASKNDVWAVGYANGQTLTLHWDGSEWKIVPSPDMPGENYLSGVEAISANDVWAIGSHGDHHTPDIMALHWDGSRWRVVPTPQVGKGTTLKGISALSSNDVWAVGMSVKSEDSSTATLTMRWDGKQWSVMPSPSVGKWLESLNGVVALPSGDVWAVGSSGFRSLVLRYMKSPCATPLPLPTKGP